MMSGPLSFAGDLGPLPPVGITAGRRPGSPASLMRRCAATVIDLPIAVVVILVPLVGLDRALGALGVADATAGDIWLTAAAAG